MVERLNNVELPLLKFFAVWVHKHLFHRKPYSVVVLLFDDPHDAELAFPKHIANVV
jgi:hypothetical protein